MGDFMLIFKKTMENIQSNQNQSKFSDLLFWSLSAFIGLLIFFALIMLLVGFRPAVVLTGSMEPTISPGDMIVYKSIDENDLKIGDVVTFYMTEESQANHSITYTHRVVNVLEKNNRVVFQMQGDANQTPDANLIPIERILGKVHYVMPIIGQTFLFVKNNMLIVISGLFVLFFIVYFVKKLLKNWKYKNNSNA